VNTSNGHLNVRRYGEDGAPVMMLHGFTLTGAMFEPIAERTSLSVHAPDLPGHGSTTVPASFPEVTKHLALYLQDHGPMPIVGYSLGGRVGLHVALEYPDLVPLLVIISSSFGIEDFQERSDRAEREVALARSIRDGSIEGFVDRWLTHPVAAPCGLDETTKAWDRSVRLENTTEGLAAALEGLGQGQQEWLGDSAQSLPMHVIVVTGSRDTKYGALTDAWCAAAEPDGASRCHVVVPRAGHNLIVEQPDHVAPLIENLVTSGDT
jgi:2-succinyl-6-hydroxy-2,4-cyclohexadiene-1-carboxylate synthase